MRKVAARKFERAAEMLFDREALEMASSEAVAAYHASLFPVGEAVVDLTAGIGADTIGFARRGPVIAYELAPDRAELLRHNLAVNGADSDVRVGDGLEHPPAAYVFADPARRDPARRSRQIDAYQPAPAEILAAHPSARRIALKLSPLLVDDAFPKLAEGRPYQLEFLSYRGECPEALFMIGSEIEEIWRGAVHLDSGDRLAAADLYDHADEAGAYLYEADPAAIRAHALGSFGLAGLGDSNGYLTGDELIDSPWLRRYRVLADGPGDDRKTEHRLRELGIGTPEVKLRGLHADPIKLRKRWKQTSGRPGIVVLYPAGPRIRHAIVEAI
ncbi:MAG: hypothetical protein IT363_06125 [Methanoregulaceae archaeon]|nr:hypothetical protein [Methanoregulaceae archaeon]